MFVGKIVQLRSFKEIGLRNFDIIIKLQEKRTKAYGRKLFINHEI